MDYTNQVPRQIFINDIVKDAVKAAERPVWSDMLNHLSCAACVSLSLFVLVGYEPARMANRLAVAPKCERQQSPLCRPFSAGHLSVLLTGNCRLPNQVTHHPMGNPSVCIGRSMDGRSDWIDSAKNIRRHGDGQIHQVEKRIVDLSLCLCFLWPNGASAANPLRAVSSKHNCHPSNVVCQKSSHPSTQWRGQRSPKWEDGKSGEISESAD